MNHSHDPVILDVFDREYGLDDLLPESALEPMMTAAIPILSGALWVVRPCGEPYYRHGVLAPELASALKGALEKSGTDPVRLGIGSAENASAFAVMHEMAPLGYLIMGGAWEQTENPGRFIAACLARLAQANCRSLMATGIHGQVVTENHQRLMKKTSLLEKSEQKHRQLAQNLEKEVARQTRKIEAAQIRFMHQEKMASIGQLAAGVAHEINNPMGFVSSNLHTLNEYQNSFKALITAYRELATALAATPDDLASEITAKIDAIASMEKKMDIEFLLEDGHMVIQESMEGADRIKKIVADLKDFAHPGEQNLQVADINQNLDATLSIAANELKYKTKVIRRYGVLPRILCYPQQLNQVFLNLLINAAQSIQGQGEIRIETEVQGESVRIAFSDNGCGIPPDQVAKIFDPFFTTKPIGKGTGLGLNVAYNIVKKHHGTIDVKSRPDLGTTFAVKIPVSQPKTFTREEPCLD